MDSEFYDWCRRRVGAGELIEDERIADWRYTVTLRPESTVVIVGAGQGAVALALARTCRRVLVLDADAGRLAVVERRAREQGLPQIETRLIEKSGKPGKQEFDVAAVRGDDCGAGSIDIRGAIQLASALVKPGGLFSLTVENAWSFSRMFQKPRGVRREAWTLGRYRAELRRAGFRLISVNAVLPSAAAPPLFWVPLQPQGAFAFFLKDLAGLLDLASPEAKAGFAHLRKVAAFGVRATVAAGAANLAARFVPAFGLMAERSVE